MYTQLVMKSVNPKLWSVLTRNKFKITCWAICHASNFCSSFDDNVSLSSSSFFLIRSCWIVNTNTLLLILSVNKKFALNSTLFLVAEATASSKSSLMGCAVWGSGGGTVTTTQIESQSMISQYPSTDYLLVSLLHHFWVILLISYSVIIWLFTIWCIHKVCNIFLPLSRNSQITKDD